MENIIFLLAALGVLFYVLKLDASWVRVRIEMTLAMVGIDYKPSRRVCFIIAVIVFYLIYGVIFNR